MSYTAARRVAAQYSVCVHDGGGCACPPGPPGMYSTRTRSTPRLCRSCSGQIQTGKKPCMCSGAVSAAERRQGGGGPTALYGNARGHGGSRCKARMIPTHPHLCQPRRVGISDAAAQNFVPYDDQCSLGHCIPGCCRRCKAAQGRRRRHCGRQPRPPHLRSTKRVYCINNTRTSYSSAHHLHTHSSHLASPS